jgi:hypothetical protein
MDEGYRLSYSKYGEGQNAVSYDTMIKFTYDGHISFSDWYSGDDHESIYSYTAEQISQMLSILQKKYEAVSYDSLDAEGMKLYKGLDSKDKQELFLLVLDCYGKNHYEAEDFYKFFKENGLDGSIWMG